MDQVKRGRPRKERPQVQTPSEAESIAPRLISAREALGWSQRDLEARSGVRKTTISDLEQGPADPKRSTLIRLARALGVSAAWLAFGTHLSEPG